MSNWKDKCINIELFPLIFNFNINPKLFENIDSVFNLIALISIEFDCEDVIFTEPSPENEKINCINRLLYLITNDQFKKCICYKRSIINNIYELANLLSFNRSLDFVKKSEQFDKIFTNLFHKELKRDYFGEFRKEFNIDRFNQFIDNYNQFKNNENELRIKLNNLDQNNNLEEAQQLIKEQDQQSIKEQDQQLIKEQDQQLIKEQDHQLIKEQDHQLIKEQNHQLIEEQIAKFEILCKIYKLTDFKDRILLIDYELSLDYFRNYYDDYKLDNNLILDNYHKFRLQNYLNKFTICNLNRKDNYYFTNQDLELILDHFSFINKLINLRTNYYLQLSNLPKQSFEQLNYFHQLEVNLNEQKKNLNEQKYSITSEQYDLQVQFDTQKLIQRKILTLENAFQIEQIKDKIKLLNKEKQLIFRFQKKLTKQINKLHAKLLKEEIKNKLLEDEVNRKIELNKLYDLLNEQLDCSIEYIQSIIRPMAQKNMRSNFEKRILKLDEQDVKIDEQKIILDNELTNLRIKQFELCNHILLETKIIPDQQLKEQLESIERQQLIEYEAINEKLLNDQGLQIRKAIETQLGKSIEEYTTEYLIFEDMKKKAIKLNELTEIKSDCHLMNYEIDNKILQNYQQINLNLDGLFETIKLLYLLLNSQTTLSFEQHNLLQIQQEQIILNLQSIKKQSQLIFDTSQILKEQKQLCLEYLLDRILFIRRSIVSENFFQIFYTPPNNQKLTELFKLQKQLLFVLPNLSNELVTKLPQISEELQLIQPTQSIYLEQTTLNDQTNENIELIKENILSNLIDLKSTIEILKSLSLTNEVQLNKKELSEILQSQQTQILLNLELIYQQLNTIINLSEQFISSNEKQVIVQNLNNQLLSIRESIEHNLIKMTNCQNKLEELNFFQIHLINNLLSISFGLATNLPNSTDKSQQLLGELYQMLNKN